MLNKILILLLAILLPACASNPVIKAEVQKVDIPIEVACKAEIPSPPDLNFDKLKQEQDIYDKTKALTADRQLQKGYEAQLLAALTSCVK